MGKKVPLSGRNFDRTDQKIDPSGQFFYQSSSNGLHMDLSGPLFLCGWVDNHCVRHCNVGATLPKFHIPAESAWCDAAEFPEMVRTLCDFVEASNSLWMGGPNSRFFFADHEVCRYKTKNKNQKMCVYIHYYDYCYVFCIISISVISIIIFVVFLMTFYFVGGPYSLRLRGGFEFTLDWWSEF